MAGHGIEYFCFAKQIVSFSSLSNLIKFTRFSMRFSVRPIDGTTVSFDCVFFFGDRMTRGGKKFELFSFSTFDFDDERVSRSKISG